MSKNIKDLLKENTKDILSDAVLAEIENLFNEAVAAKSDLRVDASLTKQDEDHANKVQKLLEAIDTDHTKKLNRIVEAINENHTRKLQTVVKRYQTQLNIEAVNFKATLVDSMSNYLDLYVTETFPKDMLEEVVRNKRSENVLREVRKILSVDMILAKDEIRGAIVDGKNQIVEANKKTAVLTEEVTALKNHLAATKSALVLEKLTADLPAHKKAYAIKVLSRKTEHFITENFKYTLELFDKNQSVENEILVKEAKTGARGNVDSIIEEVVTESDTTTVDEDANLPHIYMHELGKY